MKKILIALSAVIVVLSACQKEPSFEDPNSIPGGGSGGGGTGGGGTTPSGLLVRAVEVSGTDSNISVYSYDAAKRLVQMDVSNTAGVSLLYKIVRNSSGIITNTLVKSPQLVAFGIDSIPMTLFYNASSSRYTHSRFDILLSGIPFSDSTVFSYDGGGNLISSTSYGKSMFGSYEPLSRANFTYAGGNVVSQKYYDYDPNTSTYEHAETTNFTYDAKVNPLKLGVEGIIIGSPTTFGNNNATVSDYINATDPSENFTHTSTLTYNNINKPAGGTRVEDPGAVNFTLRFYYN